MYSVLIMPKDALNRLGVYHFVLALSFILCVIVVGIIVAIVVDTIRAIIKVMRNE